MLYNSTYLNIQNSQIHRDRKQISCVWGWRLWEMGSDYFMGAGFPFGGDEKILELNSGGDCTTQRMPLLPPNCNLDEHGGHYVK